jgi:NAD(P)-dependent dehydrogenase (short-subunit alcohol dehydrogenase family)
MQIRNSTFLITGGSRGLGRALGAAVAGQGGRVVLVGRRPEDLDEAVREIRSTGGDAYGIPADIGDKHAVYRIAGEAAALAGPVDVLVHNASTLGPVPLRLLLDTDCEDLQRVLDVNLIGAFRLTKAIAGPMALRGGGVVLSISSDAAVEAYPGWGSYSVAKAALDHMSRIFAVELQDAGVRFFSIDPGEMNTRMHADAIPDCDPAGLARPEDIASRIVEILRESDRIASGSRLQAARSGALR